MQKDFFCPGPSLEGLRAPHLSCFLLCRGGTRGKEKRDQHPPVWSGLPLPPEGETPDSPLLLPQPIPQVILVSQQGL